MGRTLHYRLLAPKPIPPSTWRKIESVQSAMNDLFTWTCENLKLDPMDDEDRRFYGFKPDEPSDPPVQGWGFTKVASDEWNALLVVRFVRWVSEIIPDITVKLSDEGGYILARDLIFEAGNERLDGARVARARAYLEAHGYEQKLRLLGTAVALAEQQGLFYGTYPAIDYAERKEITALGIPKRQLTKLTLDDLAEQMRFPWQQQAA